MKGSNLHGLEIPKSLSLMGGSLTLFLEFALVSGTGELPRPCSVVLLFVLR